MTLTSVRHRRIGAAGVAAGALVASALLFTPSAQAALADVREAEIAKTADPYAGWHQDVAGGQFRVINEGLELTGDSAVVRGYTNNTSENLGTTGGNVEDLGKLADTSVTAASGSPVFKVFVYSDGVTGDKLTTLSPVGAATGDWTSSAAIDAPASGTDVAAGAPTPIATIVDALKPNYRVKGFGVASASGTTVVSKIIFNGDTYQFKNNAPVVADRTISTKINTAVSVPLTASDVDGNELTYTPTSVVGGTVSGSGATQTFTPAKNFKGNASVAYTVTDGRGGSASATVTIKVAKSQGKVDIYRIHPAGKISVRNTVYVYASIFVDGAKAKQGTTVRVYAKSKLVGTSKVNSSGKVKVKLPNRLPAGNATLKVTQVGSATLNGDSDSIKVKVRK